MPWRQYAHRKDCNSSVQNMSQMQKYICWTVSCRHSLALQCTWYSCCRWAHCDSEDISCVGWTEPIDRKKDVRRKARDWFTSKVIHVFLLGLQLWVAPFIFVVVTTAMYTEVENRNPSRKADTELEVRWNCSPKGTNMHSLNGKIESHLDKNLHWFAEIAAFITMLGFAACTLLGIGWQVKRLYVGWLVF